MSVAVRRQGRTKTPAPRGAKGARLRCGGCGRPLTLHTPWTETAERIADRPLGYVRQAATLAAITLVSRFPANAFELITPAQRAQLEQNRRNRDGR